VALVNAPAYVVYFGVTGLTLALSIVAGKRGFCHTVCWMAPFMILGRKLSNALRLPALRLSADVRHNLFLAVKEVLHNVVRHAHASEVRVTFALRDGVLEIAIADNGQGFDPSTPVEGNGLENLRQRLAGIGGRCEIQAQPGTGATVRLVLPLPANPQPA
jgi:glucose-6-phosphate-specific signal transduction histidine kinase